MEDKFKEIFENKDWDALQDKDLKGVDFKGVDFSNQFLSNIKFDGAILDKANFENTHIWLCSFSYTELNNVNFTKSEMQMVKFDGATFLSCCFDKCYMYTVNMKFTKMGNVSFKESKLLNVDFAYSDDLAQCQSGIDFQSSTITDSNFDYSKIIGYNFSNAELKDVSFENSSWNIWNRSHGAKLDFKTMKKLLKSVFSMDCDDGEYFKLKIRANEFLEDEMRAEFEQISSDCKVNSNNEVITIANEKKSKAIGKIIGVSLFMKDMPKNTYSSQAFVDVIRMLTNDLDSASQELDK